VVQVITLHGWFENLWQNCSIHQSNATGKSILILKMLGNFFLSLASGQLTISASNVALKP
jgi:hypothetical protein